MVNIFSGVLGGGSPSSGSSAMDRIKYQQEMDEYEAKRARYQREQDVRASQPEFEKVISTMSPELQAQARMFRKFTTLRSMGDQGLAGVSDVASSRRGIKADDIKQRLTTDQTTLRGIEATDQANIRHQYKVDHPVPEGEASEASKIQVAKAYIGSDAEWERLQLPENRLERQQVMRDAWRDRDLVDVGTGYADVYSGKEVISKNLLQAGVTKARIPIVTASVTDFRGDVNNAELSLRGQTKQLENIRFLYENVEGNTGWWSALQILPDGTQRTWSQVRDTVISNIGLEKLMELKAGSKQGATGLGALNEKELEMLQKHKGSLDAAQSPEELKRVLKSMADDIANFQRDTMRELESARNMYKSNGLKYFGMSEDEVNFIPKSQQYLFTGGAYEPQSFANPLDPVKPVSAAEYLEANQ